MSRELTAAESDLMSQSLGRLDKIAKHIQDNHAKWGMPFEQAKSIVNALDRTADEVETFVFGPESFQTRQHEVMVKEAKVHQRDADEGYMDTFDSVQGVIQSDADEGYMTAYKDDQSSAVRGGTSSTGRPLAPGHTSDKGPQQGAPSA